MSTFSGGTSERASLKWATPALNSSQRSAALRGQPSNRPILSMPSHIVSKLSIWILNTAILLSRAWLVTFSFAPATSIFSGWSSVIFSSAGLMFALTLGSCRTAGGKSE